MVEYTKLTGRLWASFPLTMRMMLVESLAKSRYWAVFMMPAMYSLCSLFTMTGTRSRGTSWSPDRRLSCSNSNWRCSTRES